MDIRNNIPEELKNQMVDGKPKILTEKIPEKFLDKIKESRAKKQLLYSQLLQLTVNILDAEAEQKEVNEKIKGIGKNNTKILNDAFKKLKLAKRKYYHWRFDNKDSFIGIYNPPAPTEQIKPVPPVVERGDKPETLKPPTQ